jgi:hypothetical protein
MIEHRVDKALPKFYLYLCLTAAFIVGAACGNEFGHYTAGKRFIEKALANGCVPYDDSWLCFKSTLWGMRSDSYIN